VTHFYNVTMISISNRSYFEHSIHKRILKTISKFPLNY